MKIFDRKFGDTFESLPDSSGVYLFFDGEVPVYVGKAKSLRKRLSQYRNASRTKRDRKRWQIIKAADRLEFRTTDSEQDALLLENKLIVDHKPLFNVDGAYSFAYPVFGMKRDDRGDLRIAYSTEPECLHKHGYRNFGAFRSRWLTRDAFRGFRIIFSKVGHREPTKKSDALPFTAQLGFRAVSDRFDDLLQLFLSGREMRLLQELSLHLLDVPMTDSEVSDIEDSLKDLRSFFRDEARILHDALHAVEGGLRFVPQRERDALMIRARDPLRTGGAG